MLAKLLGAVLLTLGVESILFGFLSYLMELWALHDLKADKEAPPRHLVALAELIRALTHVSPLIALTALGVLLIVIGTMLRRLRTNG